MVCGERDQDGMIFLCAWHRGQAAEPTATKPLPRRLAITIYPTGMSDEQARAYEQARRAMDA